MTDSSQVAGTFLVLAVKIPQPEETLHSGKTGKLVTLFLGKLQVCEEHVDGTNLNLWIVLEMLQRDMGQ